MDKYNHKDIEEKWQKKWKEDNLYVSSLSGDKNKDEYILVEFPYPSGNLHVGHWYAFAITDIYARFRKMSGKNVLFPIGFDAFGLPAENAAIKRNLNPKNWTYENIETMKKQLASMGAMFDWSRELATCDPEYYKWTQWIFTEFFKNNLAYQADTPVNWCPSCKTVLANEQVVDGTCERCDSQVEQRNMKQWLLKITDYADRLVDDLEELDWPEPIKHSQRNWIGRSNGSYIDFKIKDSNEIIKVFTTRADTLFGVTYMVLAPEHLLVSKIKDQISNKEEVEEYVQRSQRKTELERQADSKEKTGVLLKDIKAINPINNEEVPVFIADYVLLGYGTGAIMAVPAHDERDKEFAEKFNLPIKEVISEANLLINSSEFNGLDIETAKEKITQKVKGEITSTYRLRDWLVSRQRYWGCPIPIIHCKDCGAVPVPEKDLPVILPEIEDYLPRDDGKSPLAKAEDWVKTTCPKCNKDAERETDTLDTFIDSSWYFARYLDSKNQDKFADENKLKSLPVDFYSGGAEHTTMHLLYARFFTKALYDLKLLPVSEPFTRRLNRGLIMGPDGQKMSKSKGNVVDPDIEVEKVGSDSVRMYLAFIGPYNEVGSYPWDPNGIVGVRRFIERIWSKSDNFSDNTDPVVEKELHKTILKVKEDSSKLKFNTAISQMMILINKIDKNISKKDFEIFLKLLAPFAPHIAEELWYKLGNNNSIHLEKIPAHNPDLLIEDSLKIAVQINGKVRGTIDIKPGIEEEEIKNKVLEDENFSKWLDGAEIKRFVYVPNKVINIVL